MIRYLVSVPGNEFKREPDKYLDIFADMSQLHNFHDASIHRISLKFPNSDDRVAVYKFYCDMTDEEYMFMKLKHDINFKEYSEH